jgi:DNA polymerase III subunit gamma/tau
MALYRTYRPKTLDDLVGQEHITDILRAQAKSGTYSQNYLLCGTRGAGKTSTARLIAKLVNAQVFDNNWFPDLINDPLAKRIDTWWCIDIIEIDAASHTGVDNVREEIIEKAPYPPHELKKKVYIIDEVHMLSKWAFNALLKIMEEPPLYIIFILATTELHKVPDTIVSRSQLFLYKRIPLETLVARLCYIADAEGITYTVWWMRLLARAAAGWMRDAIKYLEQLHIVGSVDEENVSRYLWIVTDDILEQRYCALRDKNSSVLMNSVVALLENNTDFTQFTKALAFYADDRFAQDPQTSSMIIGMTTTLLDKARSFPYLHILYKQCITELWFGSSLATKQALVLENAPLVSEKVLSTWDSVWNNNSHESLLTTIATQMEQKLLRMTLAKSAYVHAITETEVHIIVIQQQLYWLVTKPEISQDIEKKIAGIIGKSIYVKWEYMSKEEFLLQ